MIYLVYTVELRDIYLVYRLEMGDHLPSLHAWIDIIYLVYTLELRDHLVSDVH